MTARTITAARLREAGACRKHRDVFDALFPSGSVRVTQKLAVEHAASFSWSWAARRLLSTSAWAECCRVTAPAYAECRKVADAARTEYFEAPDAARDAAWAEYRKVADAAWAEYLKVEARTFAKLYNADGAR